MRAPWYLIKAVFLESIASWSSSMVQYFWLTVLCKLIRFNLRRSNNIHNDVDNVDTSKYFFLLNAAILCKFLISIIEKKWEVLLYVFIIFNGRFSFKSNFIPGWNSRVSRYFFVRGWDFISVTFKCTPSILHLVSFLKPFLIRFQTEGLMVPFLAIELDQMMRQTYGLNMKNDVVNEAKAGFPPVRYALSQLALIF